MLDELAKLFDDITLTWCDNPGYEIHNSDNYIKLISIFPNLRDLFQKFMTRDIFEFNRTLRHIFRILKIYHLLKQGEFNYVSLTLDTIQKIRQKIINLSNLNETYLPIIFVYHDIGRFINRTTHPFHSSQLIQKNHLFDLFELTEIEQLLLKKIIEYHLFIATVFTGESTFFGILSLFNDREFIELISNQNKNYANIFVDLLEVFTYLDVLGYPYSRVFDHYLKYYESISTKLKKMLALWPNLDKIMDLAREYSIQWTDWRLAGALRIFQFIGTKPHLTADFYFGVLRESLRPEYEKQNKEFDWNLIKSHDLSNIYKFQLNYSLAFLLTLAFGEFKRFRLKEGQQIAPKLLLFWILLSAEVKKRDLTDKDLVWKIYFDNLPFWSDLTKKFIAKLKIDSIKSVIQNALSEFDEEKKEFSLILDFSELTD